MPTKIDWCDEVWNPVTGCTKVSPGCANCYAARMAPRLAGRFGYDKDDPFKVTLHSYNIDLPRKWKKPRRIFVCSMGDLFHKDVPYSFISRVWNTMIMCPQHTFIILTKRAERMAEFVADGAFFAANAWLGISAESQLWLRARIEPLQRMPAAIRFISYEPALGELYHLASYLKQHNINWFIAGCESGPKRRPAPHDWFRYARDQCQVANVPFFLKQMSANPDGTGKIIKMPELDGKVWAEFPKARS